MQITNKPIAGFGYLTPNEMPQKYILKTVSGAPPLVITDAKAAVPESITIFGNTAGEVEGGDEGNKYAVPILQTAAVPIHAYSSSYPADYYGTDINVQLVEGQTYTIRFRIDSLSVSSGWAAFNARNYSGLSSKINQESFSIFGGYVTTSLIGTHSAQFTPTVNGYLWLQAYNCNVSDIILLKGAYDSSEILDTDIYIDNQYLGLGCASEYKLYIDKPILSDEFAVYNIARKSAVHDSTDISLIQDWSGIPKLAPGINIFDIHTEIPPSDVEFRYRTTLE
ncbi:MAG: hypothetical protein ACI38A_09145 [Candidatus Ornithomonoglobus sp.]